MSKPMRKPYSPAEEEEDDYISLPSPRVLLLDDNRDLRRSLVTYLNSHNCIVDAVETSQEAVQLLNQYSYQNIFVDIDLLPYDIPGDKFIADNRQLMGEASLFVITGQNILETIGPEREHKINQMGARILIKGSPIFQHEVVEAIEQKMKEIREAIIMHRDRLYGLKTVREAPPPPEVQLQTMLRTELLEWLRSRTDVDKKGVYYGGRLYSMEELAKEVEDNTPIGQTHLKMIFSLFKRLMR